jgi:glycerol-3-phosphate dehydrogenase
MKISVLGAGAWGTALAKVLHENNHVVTLCDINAAMLRKIFAGYHAADKLENRNKFCQSNQRC